MLEKWGFGEKLKILTLKKIFLTKTRKVRICSPPQLIGSTVNKTDLFATKVKYFELIYIERSNKNLWL